MIYIVIVCNVVGAWGCVRIDRWKKMCVILPHPKKKCLSRLWRLGRYTRRGCFLYALLNAIPFVGLGDSTVWTVPVARVSSARDSRRNGSSMADRIYLRCPVRPDPRGLPSPSDDPLPLPTISAASTPRPVAIATGICEERVFLVLPYAPSDRAASAAARIRAELAAKPVRHRHRLSFKKHFLNFILSHLKYNVTRVQLQTI